MNSGLCWLTTVALLLSSWRAVAQTSAPSLSSARVGAQVGLSTLAAPVGFFGAGVATKMLALRLGVDTERAGRYAYAAAYAGTGLATALVPSLVGRDGKFPAALGGSALGILAAHGVARLGNLRYDDDRHGCGVICWTLGAVVVALPGVGATIAYNESRR